MKKSYLIADSGGTKTDWCYVDVFGTKNYFTTASYHPNLMSDEWINSNKAFWNQYTLIDNLEVHFYGSGCLKEPNRSKVENVFKIFGFKNIFIESDILAAARACFGDENGFVGILGTGSVLAEIENREVKNVYGGLGSIIGDEGSGFYFGKLLIEKYVKNEFSKVTNEEIESVIGIENLIGVNSSDSTFKEFVSSFSSKFSATKNQEIKQLHRDNISLFFDKYLPLNISNLRICFVGSYAQYNRDIIKNFLEIRSVNLGVIITRPIEFLTEYSIKSIL
jgi:N-acetylglucosamine kinase-like BadF-type ATPase